MDTKMIVHNSTDNQQHLFYDSASFEKDCEDLIKTLDSLNLNPNIIVGIKNGGKMLTDRLVSYYSKTSPVPLMWFNNQRKPEFTMLGMPQLDTVFIVDDILDTGDTLVEITKRYLRMVKSKTPKVICWITLHKSTNFVKDLSKELDAYIINVSKNEVDSNIWIDYFWETKLDKG
jgi:hypoxanthine phosphoribosyltransferase